MTYLEDKFNKSYADILKGGKEVTNISQSTRTLINDFKSVVREERNDQLIQERERKAREANFIIHGLREEISDKDLINFFLSAIDLKSIPKECKRLCKQIGNKTRPFKLERKST